LRRKVVGETTMTIDQLDRLTVYSKARLNARSGASAARGMLGFIIVMLSLASSTWAVSLNVGDILVADGGRQAIIAINSSTGAQSLITSGNLLQQPVGVGFMASGELVVVDRINGLTRVNPATGAQSVLSSFVNSDTFA